jgi:hypothetical protein
MKSKLLFITTVLTSLLFSGVTLLAQDSTETKEDKWDWSWEYDEFEQWVVFGRKMPTISFLYGITDVRDESISDPLADANLLELQLGHTTRKTSRYADNILQYKFKYLFFSYISSDLSGGSDNNGIKSRNWRFGFAGSKGYGYKFGDAAIILYSSYSYDWTKVDFTNNATNESDQITMDRFEDGIRFGSSNDGGIRIVATSLISLDVNYQRSIVFERHLFWKWAGSAIIEAAANGLLDVFIKEIFDSSPQAGPIVNFLLKNALAYGIYELRHEKMNWPFPSTPPLSFDTFRFGATFTF